MYNKKYPIESTSMRYLHGMQNCQILSVDGGNPLEMNRKSMELTTHNNVFVATSPQCNVGWILIAIIKRF